MITHRLHCRCARRGGELRTPAGNAARFGCITAACRSSSVHVSQQFRSKPLLGHKGSHAPCDADIVHGMKGIDMKTSTVPSRAERRDRALRLRRRITATVAAAGVTGVGVAGFLIAQNATTGTTSTAVATIAPVADDSVTGDDGVSRVASSALSTAPATSGSATKATTVSGGSTVVARKP